MANTFLLANNKNIGNSLVEEDLIQDASNIQSRAKKLNCELILPLDVVCGKNIKDMDIDDDAFKSIEAIINSMTPKERSNPEILNGSRRKRIAVGSGNSVNEVNKLIKQFSQMSKMMKMMQGGGKNRVMDMFNNQMQRR